MSGVVDNGMRPFEQVEHTADYAIIARGCDLRELVENAGRGMISLLVEAEALTPRQQLTYIVRADSPERLLIESLRELLHLEEDEGLVPMGFAVVRLSEESLEAECDVGVVSLDEARPYLLGGIKAVTYHDLVIKPTPSGLEVQVVFDV